MDQFSQDMTAKLSVNAASLGFMDQELMLKSDGGNRILSGAEALVQAHAKSALGGNAHVQKDLLNRMGRAEKSQSAEEEKDRLFWLEYKARYQAFIDKSLSKGETPAVRYPLPEDIIINEDGKIRFVGPMDENSARRTEFTCRLRDTFIIQDVWNQKVSDIESQRGRGSQKSQNQHSQVQSSVTGALVLSMTLESTPPPRFAPVRSGIGRLCNALPLDAKAQIIEGTESELARSRHYGQTRSNFPITL